MSSRRIRKINDGGLWVNAHYGSSEQHASVVKCKIYFIVIALIQHWYAHIGTDNLIASISSARHITQFLLGQTLPTLGIKVSRLDLLYQH